MEKVLIAADEVEKWKHLYEGLKHKWYVRWLILRYLKNFMQ